MFSRLEQNCMRTVLLFELCQRSITVTFSFSRLLLRIAMAILIIFLCNPFAPEENFKENHVPLPLFRTISIFARFFVQHENFPFRVVQKWKENPIKKKSYNTLNFLRQNEHWIEMRIWNFIIVIVLKMLLLCVCIALCEHFYSV